MKRSYASLCTYIFRMLWLSFFNCLWQHTYHVVLCKDFLHLCERFIGAKWTSRMKGQLQAGSSKRHHVKRSKNEKRKFDFIEILWSWPFVMSTPKWWKLIMESVLILTTFLLLQVRTECYWHRIWMSYPNSKSRLLIILLNKYRETINHTTRCEQFKQNSHGSCSPSFSIRIIYLYLDTKDFMANKINFKLKLNFTTGWNIGKV